MKYMYKIKKVIKSMLQENKIASSMVMKIFYAISLFNTLLFLFIICQSEYIYRINLFDILFILSFYSTQLVIYSVSYFLNKVEIENFFSKFIVILIKIMCILWNILLTSFLLLLFLLSLDNTSLQN